MDLISFYFLPFVFWIASVILAGYGGYELGRLSHSEPETTGPATVDRPKPEPKPKPEPEPEPEPEEWVKPWLWEWAKSLRAKPQDLGDLQEWASTLGKIAFTQFGGGVSAKCHLHPLVRSHEEFEHIPPKWRSLRALEKLQQALRQAGLVELPNQRKGLILTDAGIDELQADPERWYP